MGSRENVVQWDDSYKLGVEQIDEQHRVLFDIMNHLWSAIVRRASKDEMVQIVNELEHYTVSHFTAEEAFMQSANYSGFGEHKKLHDQFVMRIREAKAEVQQGKQISLDLLHFLRDWLVSHIMVKDRAYANEYEQTKQPKSGFGRFFSRLLRG
jgi:hemerythrin